MPEHYDVFLSYGHADEQAAANLLGQLERGGLTVFRDRERIRKSDLWLDRLQQALEACGSFVLLVGRDGIRRWIVAETQVALNRYFGAHDDARRLPIFPILLDAIQPDTLPAFVRLFQGTPWNGSDPLPATLVQQIRDRAIVASKITFEGCPFVGLDAFRPDQAQLFFGRHKETLDALACFDTRPGCPTVRWLEITGNSGSGKSSLMNAGLLPLADQGWLWPRTRYERWRRIGPMMPGEHPVAMLAEQLARAFSQEMSAARRCLEEGDEHALAEWLRGRKPDEQTAFLLAVDQFEELFTFADPTQRRRFDLLLATALADPDCPLFAISTVRSDFLDRFDELLPRLVPVRNRSGKLWTMPLIGAEALREIVSGPARLAGLDVSEVQETMVDEAQDEPGALPLIQNALHWLWEHRTKDRLSGRLFIDQGRLAGILSRNADDLLITLGDQRDHALELLSRLVKVDPEARRHSRRRIPFATAVAVVGGGEVGRALVHRLAGERARDGSKWQGPLRLITIAGEAGGRTAAEENSKWVNLIHETLIRSKGPDVEGRPQPYWSTLWNYLEQHMDRAAWRERLNADTLHWLQKQKSPADLWSHERVREAMAALTKVGPKIDLSSEEREFLGPIDAREMLAELERFDTSHRRRALIGERLDVLGDPRRGVGLDDGGVPDIDWCPVPGGDVVIKIGRRWLGGTKRLNKSIDPFLIGRYPITVAQYRAFLHEEDGWSNQVWWKPELSRDPDGDGHDFGRFGNHPAVYVSWFDAMAFCRWLGHRLTRNVFLPDEWQWQQAATGGRAENVFPWGLTWDPKLEAHRANTFESRLGGITAVGMYPSGASDVKTLDMAGTAWEWCLNKYDSPYVTESFIDDFDARVLRGGSWSFGQDVARCDARNRFNPHFRSVYRGFRVACSRLLEAADH